MLIALALASVTPPEAADGSYPSALEAFLDVCTQSTATPALEDRAKANGWMIQAYPADIRAGFLVTDGRRSEDRSVGYASSYSRVLAEGQAYLIISRSEPLFGSNEPRRGICSLWIFDFKGAVPKDAMSAALLVEPTGSWSDEDGNEVLNWYGSPSFPHRHFQLVRSVSKTPLAGPADLAGIAFIAEYSGEVE